MEGFVGPLFYVFLESGLVVQKHTYMRATSNINMSHRKCSVQQRSMTDHAYTCTHQVHACPYMPLQVYSCTYPLPSMQKTDSSLPLFLGDGLPISGNSGQKPGIWGHSYGSHGLYLLVYISIKSEDAELQGSYGLDKRSVENRCLLHVCDLLPYP